jgi:carboxylesterase type B
MFSLGSDFLLFFTFLPLVYGTCLSCSSPASSLVTVHTTHSTVIGQHLPLSNSTIFYAVPFAQPPTGNLRFRPPKPIDHDLGVVNSTVRGNWCLRIEYKPTPQDSEDCLNLDIVVPDCADKREREALPVIVFIHG